MDDIHFHRVGSPITAVAGCSSSDSGSNKSGETEKSSDVEGRTHQIGGTVTVGEGSRAIEYTVDDMGYAEQLSNEFSGTEAGGLFTITYKLSFAR